MYCIHCGAKLEGTPKFCYKCGKPLAQISGPVERRPPPVVAPTAAPRPKRKARRRWPLTCGIVMLTLVLICSLATAGVYLWFGLHRTNQTARIVPAQTTAFVSIGPSLLHLPQLRHADNLVKGAAIFAGLPGVLEVGEAVQDNLPLDFDVDPKKDILPWIGGEMGLAILPTDRHASDVEESDSPEPDVPAGQSTVIYDGPPLILTAATRNQNASDAFLTKLRIQMEKEGVRFEEAAYRGIRITEIVSPTNIPLAYATFNRLVVVATDADTLRTSIDAAVGDGTPVLNDQEAFRNMLVQLPGNRLGTVYLDWPVLMEYARQKIGVEVLPPGSFQAIGGLGVALSLASDGLRFDYTVTYDLPTLSRAEKEILRHSVSPDGLVEVAPDDSFYYMSGQDLFLAWEILKDSDLWERVQERPQEVVQTMISPEIVLEEGKLDIVREVERETGVHLEDDLLDQMSGEYAWVVAPDAEGFLGNERIPLGLLLFAQVDNRSRVKRALNDLISALVRESDLRLYQDEINGVQVWIAEARDESRLLGYGFVKGVLFIGTSREMLHLAAEAEDFFLAEDRLFQAAMSPLPADSRGYVYVDVQQGVRTISKALDDEYKDEFNATIRPYIESIRAISMATEPMDENGVLRGVLFVYTE